MKRYYIFLVLLWAIAIIAALGQVSIARVQAKDRQTASDLLMIRSSVEGYVSEKGRLPETLDQLKMESELKQRAANENYGYEKISASNYKLCANFQRESRRALAAVRAMASHTVGKVDRDPYEHKKGYDCFEYHSSAVSHINLIPGRADNLKVCGQADVAIKSVNPKVKVTSIEPSLNRLTVESAIVNPTVGRNEAVRNQTYRWNIDPTVYNDKCTAAKLSDIKTGDIVTVYSDNSGFAVAIQKF